MLLQAGADVNGRNGRGETALKLGGYTDQRDVMDLLREHGAVA